MRYYIIAGEASGDLHGSNLVKGLCSEDRHASFRLWGGDLMLSAAEGAEESTLVKHYREGAVMGLTDVIAKASRLAANIRLCKSDILEWKPDVVILIDYPGFNMKIAEFCHDKGIKVFYYIAPKTWASREGRNRKLKAWIDKLYIVFPFEKDYFSKRGIPYEYVGNPLLDAVDNHEYSRPVEGPYIAMLAGSRKGEISRMMPICMEVADRISSTPGFSAYRFVIAGAPARSKEDYLKYIGERSNVDLVFGKTYDVLKYADAALINSGTASLEAALIATPQVVAWNSSALTFFIAKHVLKVQKNIKYISLGNLCIDKPAFRELLQEEFTAESASEELIRLIEDKEYRNNMLSDYAAIRESLGGKGASVKLAKAIIREIQ